MNHKNRTHYRDAGYTHYIRYEKCHHEFGWLEQGYPTTADAVKAHERRLRAQPGVRNVRATPL